MSKHETTLIRHVVSEAIRHSNDAYKELALILGTDRATAKEIAIAALYDKDAALSDTELANSIKGCADRLNKYIEAAVAAGLYVNARIDRSPIIARGEFSVPEHDVLKISVSKPL